MRISCFALSRYQKPFSVCHVVLCYDISVSVMLMKVGYKESKQNTKEVGSFSWRMFSGALNGPTNVCTRISIGLLVRMK